jgi:hypothetical protein
LLASSRLDDRVQGTGFIGEVLETFRNRANNGLFIIGLNLGLIIVIVIVTVVYGSIISAIVIRNIIVFLIIIVDYFISVYIRRIRRVR